MTRTGAAGGVSEAAEVLFLVLHEEPVYLAATQQVVACPQHKHESLYEEESGIAMA